MADPFEVLGQAVERKSNLRLVQAKVTAVEAPGSAIEVSIRGATLHDVPYTGSAPQVNSLVWLLVDDGVVLALT